MVKRQRPGTVTAASIINITMGGLSLLCGFIGLGANLIAQKSNLVGYISQRVPAYRFVEIGKPTLAILLSVLAIVAGIGLLGLKGWARWLAIIGGACAVLLQVGYITYEMGLVMPAVKVGGPQAGASNQTAQQAGMYFGAIGVTLLLTIPYVVAILMLLTPSTTQAFADQQRRRRDWDEEEDFDDEDDRPKPHRRSRRDER